MKHQILLFILIMFTACTGFRAQEKIVSGVYKVDFKNFKNKFTQNEIEYYSNVYLSLRYDGSFEFSKIIRENSKEGKWKLHEEREYDLIVLTHENGAATQTSRCKVDNCLIKITILSDGKLKYLPFRKIENEFPR